MEKTSYPDGDKRDERGQVLKYEEIDLGYRLVVTPCGGAPRIVRTRIPVWAVVTLNRKDFLRLHREMPDTPASSSVLLT